MSEVRKILSRFLSLVLVLIMLFALIPQDLMVTARAEGLEELTSISNGETEELDPELDQETTVSTEAAETAQEATEETEAVETTEATEATEAAEASQAKKNDVQVYAASDGGAFAVGSQTFDDLDQAVAAAQVGDKKTVVVAKDVTLTGSYVIPSGVTLLVPFDKDNTLYTTAPQATRTASTPKVYRTLTLAAGASLTVEGAISVGGQYYSAGGSQVGKMTGNYGYLWMNDGSSVTVKAGGALYAWGFVSGSGSVMVEKDATAYEWFQIGDFRGGTASACMKNRVFPFSQYFVQNVEVPITFAAGAVEIVSTDIYGNNQMNSASVDFIGDSGMFKAVSGTFTKQYDPQTDRMIYTVNGEAELNRLAINSGGLNVDSANYVLPITNNMTVRVSSGSKVTINQDISLLPGTQVYIDKLAELVVGASKKAYIYDRDQWVNQSYTCLGKFVSVGYTPTKAYTRTENDLVDALVDVNGVLTAAGTIYTTQDGANVCSSQGTGRYRLKSKAGTESETYQYTQKNTSVTAHTIPITATQLRNADNTYTQTSGAKSGTSYMHTDGKWILRDRIVITFDANDESGNKQTQDAAADADISLNENPFTRIGYSLAGWNTEPDGTGIAYADKSSVNFATDVTLYAQWTAHMYTVKWLNWNGQVLQQGQYTAEEAANGDCFYAADLPEKPEDDNNTYKFKGWDPSDGDKPVELYEDKTFTAQFNTFAKLTVTFDANGGTGTMESVKTAGGDSGTYYTLPECAFIKDGYQFDGWLITGTVGYTAFEKYNLKDQKWDDEKGKLLAFSNLTLKANWKHNDGWFTDEFGKQLYVDGQIQKTGWTVNDTKTFYLDPNTGYAAQNGIYWLPYADGYGPDQWDMENNTNYAKLGYDKNSYFIFDANGALQTELSGMVTLAADTKIVGGEAQNLTSDLVVWVVKGELLWHPGLVLFNDSYYYFPTGAFETGNSFETGKDYYVSKTNDLDWPAQWGDGSFARGKYTFDGEGKLQMFDGLTDIGSDTYYYVKGAKTYAGLIRLGDDFYYVNSACMVVKNKTYNVSKTNGLLPAGKYSFGPDGKMIRESEHLNGIVKKGSTWYYYVDGVKTYAGLIKIDGAYYYVNSKFEVIHGRNYFISKTNGLMECKTYTFDADGKMVLDSRDGIVKEGDTWYYYVGGVKTYAGLVQVNGAYYYVRSNFQVVHGQSYYVSKTNGLKSAGTYEFDADGKMVLESKNGIVKEGETWYYYRDGAKNYAGLIQIGGDYYYVRSNFEVVHGCSYFVSKTNGLLERGTYAFDAEGRLILN